MERLTTDALKLIRGNAILYGAIADHLGLAPASFKRLLVENKDDRLVKPEVLDLIKQHLAGLQDMELVVNNQTAEAA